MTTPKFRKKKKLSRTAKLNANAKKRSALLYKRHGEQLKQFVLNNIDKATMVKSRAGSQIYYRVFINGEDVAIVMAHRQTVIDRVLTKQFGAYVINHDLGYRLPEVDKEGNPVLPEEPVKRQPQTKGEMWLEAMGAMDGELGIKGYLDNGVL